MQPHAAQDELIDVCDENGRPTGDAILRREAHRQGTWHRTVHIYVLRKAQGRMQLLAHRRSALIRYPNTLDPVFGGHVKAGATDDQTALEEFEEETGVRPAPEKMRRVGEAKKDDPRAAPQDREFNTIYRYTLSPAEEAALAFEKQEVDDVEWIDLDDVRQRRDDDPEGWRPSAKELDTGLSFVEAALVMAAAASTSV